MAIIKVEDRKRHPMSGGQSTVHARIEKTQAWTRIVDAGALKTQHIAGDPADFWGLVSQLRRSVEIP